MSSRWVTTNLPRCSLISLILSAAGFQRSRTHCSYPTATTSLPKKRSTCMVSDQTTVVTPRRACKYADCHPTAAYIAQHEAPCSLPAIVKSLTMALAGGYVFHYLSSPLLSVLTPPLVTLSSLASLLVVAGGMVWEEARAPAATFQVHLQ
jgi:hypothetical protein